MARDHRAAVERGLQLKKVGTRSSPRRGRAIHPVNVRVGGFYRVPAGRARAAGRAPALGPGCGGRDRPPGGRLRVSRFEPDYEFVALRSETRYPIMEGRIASNRGLDIAVGEFEEHIIEEHVRHSNALHARLRERGAYLTGPAARFNLNFNRLSPLALEVCREVG